MPDMDDLPYISNWPLMIKSVEQILHHPETWRQSVWAVKSPESECGTAFCVAGHIANLAGAQFLWRETMPGVEWSHSLGMLVSTPARMAARAVAGPDNEPMEVQLFALEELGASYRGWAVLSALFASDNTLFDVLSFVDYMAKHDGIELPLEISDRLAAEAGAPQGDESNFSIWLEGSSR